MLATQRSVQGGASPIFAPAVSATGVVQRMKESTQSVFTSYRQLDGPRGVTVTWLNLSICDQFWSFCVFSGWTKEATPETNRQLFFGLLWSIVSFFMAVGPIILNITDLTWCRAGLFFLAHFIIGMIRMYFANAW